MKDLIILGNGMAGMTAALYAKRANLDFKIVGRDEYDFGQIANAIQVENFPCVKPQSGMELAMDLHDQLTIENDIIIEEHIVKQVRKTDDMFVINYEDNSTDEAKTVIYALGASHRKLNCEIGEGTPIHYCALCDGNLYAHKTVAIIGGGDVAFTQAEYLSKICKNVTIIMCDENVTAAPSTFDRVRKIDNIEIVYNFPIDKIFKNDNGKIIMNMTYKNVEPFGEPTIRKKSIGSFDGIFVAIGMTPNTTPLKHSSVLLNRDGYIATDKALESVNTPGFFAVGDVREKKVRQAITAASDGAIAAQSVIDYLKRVDT